jgi:hypothetical protein
VFSPTGRPEPSREPSLRFCGNDWHITDIGASLVGHIDQVSVIRVSILRQLGGTDRGLEQCYFWAGYRWCPCHL